MGIQADFSDEETDSEYCSSGDDLVIAEKEVRHDSPESKARTKVQDAGEYLNSTESVTSRTSAVNRKAIELKYIYGDDLSKNEIERRKFSTYAY